MKPFSISQSKQIYRINHWGEGFFHINDKGELTVSLDQQKYLQTSLYEIATALNKNNFSFPILVRFPGILNQRVQRLCNAFSAAMHSRQYSGNYTLIYPIKVNQQRSVIEEITKNAQVGVEAGSKSEMMAILALSLPKNSIVTCNGYKDRDYIRMALISLATGLKTYIVIEKLSELNLIVEEAAKLDITPRLGVRVKLASVGQGKWQDSGGEKSKFGLNANQLFNIIQRAKQVNLLDSLQLMHFHVGSQIPNIHDIQKVLSEAGQYYSELRSLGAPIKIINSGGGLGVDYEGTSSTRSFSKNYTVEEYANNIIYEFKEICSKKKLPEPDIITETGRAITAHHAVLITNIVDNEHTVSSAMTIHPAAVNDPDIIKELWNQWNKISPSSLLETYHNTVYWLNEVHRVFSYGLINIQQRAYAEKLIFNIFLKIRKLLEEMNCSSACYEALDELNDKLADKYFANFSLFASAPDAWAIGQVLPIVPLHRLNELPTRRATLHDLTCDSDGQFKKYVHSYGLDSSLPVHYIDKKTPYLIGVFLVGAYQEILGDMHNLFGTPHSVNVHLTKTGKYTFTDLMKGDDVQKMLHSVNFDTDTLMNKLTKSLQNSLLSRKQQHSCRQYLESVLEQSTYLTSKQ